MRKHLSEPAIVLADQPHRDANGQARLRQLGDDGYAPASSLICRCISSFPSLFRLDQGKDGWASEPAGSACANPNVPCCLLCLARVDVPDGDDQRRPVRHFPRFLDDHRGYLHPCWIRGRDSSRRLIMARPAYDVTIARCTRCNESRAGSAAHLITRDEARQIAANIVKLLELQL